MTNCTGQYTQLYTAVRIVLSQASGLPYYRQIVERISDLIRGGQLAADEALPSIRELAAELAVSVITVKKAYEDLTASGLVVQQQGRGTFVAPNASAASRAHLVADVRAELDRIVKRAIDLGLTREDVEVAVARSLSAHYRGKR